MDNGKNYIRDNTNKNYINSS